MNGAVSRQMRANTTHENVHICRIDVGTDVPVHVNSTACEHVVAAFEIIANVMPSITYAVSDTVRERETQEQKQTPITESGDKCVPNICTFR